MPAMQPMLYTELVPWYRLLDPTADHAGSEPMQALSRALNPECEHVLGDMRTLRLGRAFDVAFVQDAVMYMTSEEDLLALRVPRSFRGLTRDVRAIGCNHGPPSQLPIDPVVAVSRSGI